MPISWHEHEGKKTVQVYDDVDSQVPVLARTYEKRLRGYRTIGYKLKEQADDEEENLLL
jgi:hypothetical protein